VKLAKAGFDHNFNSSKWWNFRDSWALQQYEKNRRQGSPSIGFPDSHDTTRLAADLHGNIPGIKMRYLFAAVFSTGVMMPIGFEFCFFKRLDVVHSQPGDWEPVRCDLTGFIRAVNLLKARMPVFHQESRIDALDPANPQVFVMRKTSADGRQRALVILNTDMGDRQHVRIEHIRDLLGRPRAITDISLETAGSGECDTFEANLRPAQAVILYGER
jgi:starch synthase (maltosyl-transferring)